MTDRTSFQSRMTNIQGKPIVENKHLYAIGHREARHAAAEIALEADARIEALEALVGEMAGALEVYAEPSQGSLSTATARAAIAKHREVMG